VALPNPGTGGVESRFVQGDLAFTARSLAPYAGARMEGTGSSFTFNAQGRGSIRSQSIFPSGRMPAKTLCSHLTLMTCS